MFDQNEALKLPNDTHHDTPIGGENSNKLIRKSKLKPEIKNKNLSHLEIAEKFDLLDFSNASKLTGNKFVYLKNEAALLELGLINWALNYVTKKGNKYS